MIKLNDLTQQPLEIYDAIKEVMASGRFVKGSKVEEFEKTWANRCGMKYAIGVSSGAMALELVVQTVFSKQEFISYTSHTFKAVPNAIKRMGKNPISTLHKPDIFAHHLHDQELNYIPTVEDCSHVHGYMPKAETAIFSLFPTKILGACGDAGVIMTNNEKVYEECMYLRSHGTPNGTNARMDEIQAAILLVKIRYLDSWIKRRQEIVKIYDQELNKRTEGQFHYVYAIEGSIEKKQKLLDKGIESAFYYDEKYMALPLYPELTNEEVYKVLDVVKAL